MLWRHCACVCASSVQYASNSAEDCMITNALDNSTGYHDAWKSYVLSEEARNEDARTGVAGRGGEAAGAGAGDGTGAGEEEEDAQAPGGTGEDQQGTRA